MLYSLSKGCPIKRREIIKLPVLECYTQIAFEGCKAECEDKLQEIGMNK